MKRNQPTRSNNANRKLATTLMGTDNQGEVMKRKQAIKSSKSGKQPRAIQPPRLAEARGGSQIPGELPYVPHPLAPHPVADIWEQQHNETLIQLP